MAARGHTAAAAVCLCTALLLLCLVPLGCTGRILEDHHGFSRQLLQSDNNSTNNGNGCNPGSNRTDCNNNQNNTWVCLADCGHWVGCLRNLLHGVFVRIWRLPGYTCGHSSNSTLLHALRYDVMCCDVTWWEATQGRVPLWAFLLHSPLWLSYPPVENAACLTSTGETATAMGMGMAAAAMGRPTARSWWPTVLTAALSARARLLAPDAPLGTPYSREAVRAVSGLGYHAT